ncbi:MAG: hypothetical protein ABIK28_20595, partial [Planctomycetota bacterium]
MHSVIAIMDPSLEIKEVDTQSLSLHLKDPMISLSPAMRFIMVKVKDKDTAEPVLSAEGLF